MAENGITNPKKDWKEPFQEREKTEKTGKRKIFFKRERVSFHSRSNKFRPMHISIPHLELTQLVLQNQMLRSGCNVVGTYPIGWERPTRSSA